MRAVAAALLGVLLLAGCGGTGADTGTKRPAAVSDRLPDATLASFDGGPSLDLSTLKGPAVVNVWASWCGPCRKELPYYRDFAAKYDGVVDVVGVDWQDTQKQAAEKLIRSARVTYPLYTDPDGLLRVGALPGLVMVDADGKVTYQQPIAITSTAQLEKLVRTHLGVTS